MIKLIDKFLNQITMYRLILYYVLSLWAAALLFSFFNLLPFGPAALIISGVFITVVCLAVNVIFARIFRVPSNIESVYATAFILALIIAPLKSAGDLWFLGGAAALAMASKYILAVSRKHIFNPAALAVAFMAIILGQSAGWWVGNLYMAPLALLGGLLMVRKLRRLDLVLSFFIAALATVAVVLGVNFLKGEELLSALQAVFFNSPILFFACVMLTEPMTTPPTKNLRILYGALAGFLFSFPIHIGSVYSTPELALLAANIFSYAVSPKKKLILELTEKIPVAADIYDFLFKLDCKFNFKPGQYLEWTLGHDGQDARGIRRYFTIASSPTEKDIRMGVKFYPQASSFKNSMMLLKPGDKIVASQLAGDFVLPKNKGKKLVFIAGGIGITPFRSIIKYLLDIKQKRDIILLYSNYSPADIVYKDVFDQGEQQLGIKTVYNITNTPYPDDWRGERGFIDEQMIKRKVLDYKERIFYLSGSHNMVVAFDATLQKMGVKKWQIKKDFFPGFV
ncbi:MAG: RnfABCDGE type electron transport complex subunit D [Patescibacteria group bacterium]